MRTIKDILIICFVLLSVTGLYAQGVPIDEPPLPPDSVRIFNHFQVQVQPKFIDGDKDKYYNKNTITFPAGTGVNQGNGTVWISFVIERDGSVSTVTILRTTDTALNEEAIKIATAAKWTPGQRNGKTVRVSMLWAVKFKILIVPADSAMKK